MDKCVSNLLDIYLHAVAVEELTSIESGKSVDDFSRGITVESLEESEDFSKMIGDNIADIINHTHELKKCRLYNKVDSPLIAGMEHKCFPFNNTIDTLFNTNIKKLEKDYNNTENRIMGLLGIYNGARIIKKTAVGAIASYRCKKF